MRHSFRDRFLFCRNGFWRQTLPGVFLLSWLMCEPVWAEPSSPLESALAYQQVIVDVIAQTERSVVSIARLSPDPIQEIPAPLGQRVIRLVPGQPGYIPTDFGSGVIIAKGKRPGERYILTAAHVVFGRRWLEGDGVPEKTEWENMPIVVRLSTRHELAAELLRPQIVAADPRSDLAVLRINLSDQNLPEDLAPPIKWGDGSDVRKGEFVIALGNPYAVARDGSASASTGIVSNVSRHPWPPGGVLGNPTDESATIQHYGTLLHIDTRLDLGTSGGAVVNLKGEFIGLSMSLAALRGYEKSVGFAIPINKRMRRIIDALLEGHEVEYGFLGIQPGNASGQILKEYRDLTLQASAARVTRVGIHSPAYEGGIQPGDIILEVDHRPVYSETDLVREVGLLGPGVDVDLKILRPGRHSLRICRCRLGKWPVYDDSLLVTTRHRYPEWRGIRVDYATARRRYLPSNVLSQFPQAVVVTSVSEGSPAAQAGLGESALIVRVDNERVVEPIDFYDAVQEKRAAVLITLVDGRQLTIGPE